LFFFNLTSSNEFSMTIYASSTGVTGVLIFSLPDSEGWSKKDASLDWTLLSGRDFFDI
jgi:hypothetical protein